MFYGWMQSIEPRYSSILNEKLRFRFQFQCRWEKIIDRESYIIMSPLETSKGKRARKALQAVVDTIPELEREQGREREKKKKKREKKLQQSQGNKKGYKREEKKTRVPKIEETKNQGAGKQHQGLDHIITPCRTEHGAREESKEEAKAERGEEKGKSLKQRGKKKRREERKKKSDLNHIDAVVIARGLITMAESHHRHKIRFHIQCTVLLSRPSLQTEPSL
jgi:hypothetical protein